MEPGTKGRMELAVVLHNVRSMHNVGSIFRTADAAGVKKIFLCGITPAPLDRFGGLRPQLAKVALGAERSVPWEKAVKTAALLERLQKEGWNILAVEQSKRSVPYYRFKVRGRRQKIALVFGNELQGLPAALLKRSGAILEIPMYGKKESLNVAVAAGILLFYLRAATP